MTRFVPGPSRRRARPGSAAHPRSARCLFLAPDFVGPPGGIARHCRLICLALSRTGVEVTVVALNDRRGSVADTLPAGTGMHYYPCGGNKLRFVTLTFLSLLSRPSAIVAGHINFASLVRMAASFSGARVVASIYGIEVFTRLRDSRRRFLRDAALVLSCSQFTALRAAAVNTLPGDNFRVLHGSIDPEANPAGAIRTSDGTPSILTVSRLSAMERYKGHDVILRVLPVLLERYPGLCYDIVGGGDGRPELEALARSLGIARAVRFHGAVASDELARCYADATIFAMPSRGEGFGYVFLDAMLAGLPVVAGSGDASREIVLHGEVGLLVDPAREEEVLAALDSLLAQPDVRLRMGTRGAQRAREEFSFQNFQTQVRGYFAEVLEPDTVATPNGSVIGS